MPITRYLRYIISTAFVNTAILTHILRNTPGLYREGKRREALYNPYCPRGVCTHRCNMQPTPQVIFPDSPSSGCGQTLALNNIKLKHLIPVKWTSWRVFKSPETPTRSGIAPLISII